MACNGVWRVWLHRNDLWHTSELCKCAGVLRTTYWMQAARTLLLPRRGAAGRTAVLRSPAALKVGNLFSWEASLLLGLGISITVLSQRVRTGNRILCKFTIAWHQTATRTNRTYRASALSLGQANMLWGYVGNTNTKKHRFAWAMYSTPRA